MHNHIYKLWFDGTIGINKYENAHRYAVREKNIDGERDRAIKFKSIHTSSGSENIKLNFVALDKTSQKR